MCFFLLFSVVIQKEKKLKLKTREMSWLFFALFTLLFLLLRIKFSLIHVYCGDAYLLFIKFYERVLPISPVVCSTAHGELMRTNSFLLQEINDERNCN